MSARATSLVTMLALVAATLFIGGVLVMGAMMGGSLNSDQDCGTGVKARLQVESGMGGLTPSQLANAGAIIEEGNRQRIPVRGILIALAVANQESHFTNYANDGKGGDLLLNQVGIERSLSLPHEAVGTDHGSLGVFQQQWPWWGSMHELMTPTIAAAKFYRALLTIPNWQSESLTIAAQAVQSSAYPDAYADDEPLARELLGLPSTGAVSAEVKSVNSTGCTLGDSDPGKVAFPLPEDSSYRDNHNFGQRGGRWASVHTGTDLSVACGTPVLAATGGTIVIRTDQPWAGPRLVQVSTGIGQLTTWYAHMRTVTVAEGDSVLAGQQIGEVGALGNATGCHLHFEVHPRGGSIYQDSIDPSVWLREHVELDTVPVRRSSRSEPLRAGSSQGR